MTNNPDDSTLDDDVPAADAAEQQRPVEPTIEDTGLDVELVNENAGREANPADVMDQAIIVPLPEDDRDVDTGD